MIIYNGQILILVCALIAYAVRTWNEKRHTFSRKQMQEMRWKAQENKLKATYLVQEFTKARDFFEILSHHPWPEHEDHIVHDFIELCKVQISNSHYLEAEWEAMETYLTRGLTHMGCNTHARADINLRRRFAKNYKRSQETGEICRSLMHTVHGMGLRYKYLYLLPEATSDEKYVY